MIDCERIIELFEQCHAEHRWTKFMGACNEQKRELTLCLRAEVHFPSHSNSDLVQRKYSQRLNAEKAAEKRAKIEKAWKDIDENS